jgi:hypothetical protein
MVAAGDDGGRPWRRRFVVFKSCVILIGCQVPRKCASMVYCLTIQNLVAVDSNRLPNGSKACSESRIEENERD